MPTTYFITNGNLKINGRLIHIHSIILGYRTMLLIIDKHMIGNNLMRTFDLDDNEKWQKLNSLDNLAIFVNTKV